MAIGGRPFLLLTRNWPYSKLFWGLQTTAKPWGFDYTVSKWDANWWSDINLLETFLDLTDPFYHEVSSPFFRNFFVQESECVSHFFFKTIWYMWLLSVTCASTSPGSWMICNHQSQEEFESSVWFLDKHEGQQMKAILYQQLRERNLAGLASSCPRCGPGGLVLAAFVMRPCWFMGPLGEKMNVPQHTHSIDHHPSIYGNTCWWLKSGKPT